MTSAKLSELVRLGGSPCFTICPGHLLPVRAVTLEPWLCAEEFDCLHILAVVLNKLGVVLQIMLDDISHHHITNHAACKYVYTNVLL